MCRSQKLRKPSWKIENKQKWEWKQKLRLRPNVLALKLGGLSRSQRVENFWLRPINQLILCGTQEIKTYLELMFLPEIFVITVRLYYFNSKYFSTRGKAKFESWIKQKPFFLSQITEYSRSRFLPNRFSCTWNTSSLFISQHSLKIKATK